MASSQRIAVYPGSFDPLTNGHVDIIERGARLFDRIVVAMLVNVREDAAVHDCTSASRSSARCSRASRTSRSTRSMGCSSTTSQRKQARCIVRGLRAVSDFEYEFQMALMNRRLTPDVETVFMMPARAVHLHQLAPDQGSVLARRGGARPGAADCRAAAASRRGCAASEAHVVERPAPHVWREERMTAAVCAECRVAHAEGAPPRPIG